MILQQTGGQAESRIEEVPFSDLFGKLTVIREWFGEAEKAKAAKFLDLQKLLEENLRDLKVFRIGEIRINIYAAGVTKNDRVIA